MASQNRATIPTPPASPPRVGLLPSLRADQVTETGPMRAVGVAYVPEGCGTGGRTDPCDPGTLGAVDNPTMVEAEPFTVWAASKCSPQPRDFDYQGRARRQLAAIESYEIANELWTGSLTQASATSDGDPWPNPYFAQPAADVLTASGGEVTPMGAIQGLACLEQALGDYLHGQRGMIHCTRQTAIHWDQLGMLRREGPVVLTLLDTIVVPDAGYDGSGPDGSAAADEQIWAYGTGMVGVRLGPVVTVPGNDAEATNRSTNTITYRAERDAAAWFDECALVAAAVAIPLCDVGGLGS